MSARHSEATLSGLEMSDDNSTAEKALDATDGGFGEQPERVSKDAAPSEKEEAPGLPADTEVEAQTQAQAQPTTSEWDWETDPQNPYNWPTSKKVWQVVWVSWFAFTASMGTSILTFAVPDFVEEFGVTTTQAILPLSLYVFALGLGPVIGGPLSETIGRYWVYMIGNPLGAIFTLGAGFTHSFAALCVLRFLAGMCFAPSLAIASGTLNETFKPAQRGLPSTIFILTPFLGPGIAPVIGAFVTNRKDWRWTQWTLIFFIIFSLILAIAFGHETYHPILKRRRAKQLGHQPEPAPTIGASLRLFLTISLLRPLRMLVTEPIVGLICLYVACEFATLFSFFAAVPYVFERVYDFGVEDTGLIFLSIVVGCLLGTLTIILCDVFLYRPQVPRHPPHQVPPEYRLYPAMIGSVGLPIGLFWFGWTAREDISWASPAVAIIPFAWGNICLFISTFQYLVDTYHRSVVASAASANSLARYGLAGAFPLFTLQMYERLGIGWATSLLAFIAVVQLPLPWLFFKYGKRIRALSHYETASY